MHSGIKGKYLITESVAKHTWLGSLGRLIDKDGSELELAQSWITSTNTCTTNHICRTQDLLLALPDEGLIFALIVRAQLPLFVLQLNKLLKLNMSGAICDLLVQSQERNARIQSLTGFSCKTDNLQACGMYLLRQLIHGNVGGCTNEHLTRVHLRQMVND